ncbi:hypothetical protein SADO_13398 [Salinisphaera dokdonensis CL-ES53]|uniref:Uncharacterized protein n=1 Tax=Salinisphaera dokdonensis CL-ES53 TaxID=1304272 RepID=A0ABV2B2Z9_9GAMM
MVRTSLANELNKLAWWLLAGSVLCITVFEAEIWVMASAVMAWMTLEGVTLMLRALDDDINRTTQ